MIIRRTISLAAVLLIAGLCCAPSHAQKSHTIILAGYNSVPKVQTPATGTLTVTLNGNKLTIEGSFSGLKNYYYGSAIFYGEKREEGNQIIQLHPSIAENNTSGTFKASENTFELTEGQLDALANGNLYVSILSFDHQRGELRAQLPALKNSKQ